MKRPSHPRVFQTSADVPIELAGEWALEHRADRVLLVVPGPTAGARGHGKAAAILGDALLERFEANAWPVTQLFGSVSTVFVGRFSEAVLARMVASQPNLRRWVDPHPEDVCFFRADAPMPRFASVTHENEAYFFARTAPPFAVDPELADGIGDAIPVGRYFCSVPKP